MARQEINLGTTANDGTGTPLRTGGDMINDNFIEVYTGKVIVTQESDFASIDSTKLYELRNTIALTSPIEIPAGGITIKGLGSALTGLTAASGFIFTSDVGGSGTVNLIDLFFTGDVFDLTDIDGTNALECTNVNYINCTSLGSLTDYRQYSEINMGRFGGTPTLTFNGAMNGIFQEASIVRGASASTVLFKEGTGLTFSAGGRFFTNANVQLTTGAVFSDFQPSNFTTDEQFQISGANFSGLTSNADYLPNIDLNDTELKISNTVGLDNSSPGIVTKIDTEAVTTIAVADTDYTLIAGSVINSFAQWFTSGTTTLQATYQSTVDRIFVGQGFVSIDGGTGDNIRATLYHYDDSAGTTTEIDTATGEIPIGGTVSLSLYAEAKLSQNDYFIIGIANTSDTSNVTGQEGSKLVVSAKTGI